MSLQLLIANRQSATNASDSAPPCIASREMAARIASFAWGETSLGPRATWPPALRMAVSLVLGSRYPMFVWWGPERVNLYNDAYAPVLGARHPAALGQPASEIWPEIWDVVGPQSDAVFDRGEATWNEEVMLLMERSGFIEETYFTWSYSPIHGDDGASVAGMFCACTEETSRVLSRRRLRGLRELAAACGNAETVAASAKCAARALAEECQSDVPFALIYLLDPEGKSARLVAATGLDNATPGAPPEIELEADAPWPLVAALAEARGVIVPDLAAAGLPSLPGGPWPEPTRQAMVFQLARGGSEQPAGFLVVGVSPRLNLDDDYRSFLALLADTISAALGTARVSQIEEQFRALVEATAQVVWTTDAEGFVVEDSPSWRAFTGQTFEQWRGLGWLDMVHPGDREATAKIWRHCVATLSPYAVEYRVRHISGIWRWTLARGVPLLADNDTLRGWVGMNTDITDRKEAERALRESRDEFRQMADTAPAMLWITDSESACTFLSRSWFEFTGQDEATGLGAGWTVAVHPDDRERAGRIFREANARRAEFAFDYRLRRHDGEYRWAVDAGRPRFGPDGAFLGFIGAVIDIHERRQAEAAMRVSEEFNRRIIESSRDCIKVLDREGRLLSMSANGVRMLCIDDLGALLGQSWIEFWEDEHRANARAAVAEAMAGGVGGFVAPFLAPNGRSMWFDVVVTPILDPHGRVEQLLSVSRDISERKTAEEDVVRSRNLLKGTIDALSPHIAVLDERSVIVEVNAAWKRFADDNDLQGNYGIGKSYLAVLDEHVCGVCEEAEAARGIRGVIAGQLPRFQMEYSCHSPTGQRWYLMTVTRFAETGPARVVVAHENITARVLANLTLRDADRRKDEFLAMLAHELRNPLASVTNAATLLQEDANEADRRWAADVIARQSAQLARLVDDLLDVSRITRGKIELRKVPMDAARALESACEAVASLIAERGHTLFADFARGELWLEADPARLEQIVGNLLANAARYTDPNGHIELMARREGSEIVIVVRDSGIGIEPARIPEMFELFSQGERSNARSEGGLGIGLTVVRGLCELHDGSVAAHSDGPGKGSTFTVRLRAIPAPAGAASRDQGRTVTSEGTGVRLLIVDDNADSAHGLARLLTRRGYAIALAHDGPAALEQASAFSPDVVLLDIGLPGMDGYEVARRLRANGASTFTLIFALSGYGQDDDRTRSHAAGFDEHLVKPVDFERLRALLVDQLRARGARTPTKDISVR